VAPERGDNGHPFTYASFAATLSPRTVKISTPRRCHG
jgi:hypothetical protein